MLHELLQKIEELDESVTKGPWKPHYGGNPHDEWLSVEPETGTRTVCTVTDDHQQNAEFIALSRTALPALAEAIYQVLELHKTRFHEEDPTSKFCNFCGAYAPCETTRAIIDALGGTE